MSTGRWEGKRASERTHWRDRGKGVRIPGMGERRTGKRGGNGHGPWVAQIHAGRDLNGAPERPGMGGRPLFGGVRSQGGDPGNETGDPARSPGVSPAGMEAVEDPTRPLGLFSHILPLPAPSVPPSPQPVFGPGSPHPGLRFPSHQEDPGIGPPGPFGLDVPVEGVRACRGGGVAGACHRVARRQ